MSLTATESAHTRSDILLTLYNHGDDQYNSTSRPNTTSSPRTENASQPPLADTDTNAADSTLPSLVTRISILMSASLTLFIGVGYTNTYGVFQSHYQTTLFPTLPPSQLILIGSVSASLYLILGFLTGRFADIYGYRASLAIGSSLMIGSMFAASAASTYWQLFLTQGLTFGLGVAFVYPPATAISRLYFGASRHGLANGIVVSGGALGGCILPYAVRTLLEHYGLQTTFRILGFVALGVLVPSTLVLGANSTKIQARDRGASLLDFSSFRNGRFVCLAVACAVAMTGFLPRYFLIPASAMFAGIDSAYASWLLGLMNGLSIFGRVGIGYYADSRGKVNALSASFLLCGLGHFAFWLPGVAVSDSSAGTPTALFTLFVVYIGIFGSGFISLFPVVVAHLFGKEGLASRTGLLNSAVGFTTLAGPSAVYAIVDEASGAKWVAGVLTSGLFMVAGGLILAGGSAVTTKIERRTAVVE